MKPCPEEEVHSLTALVLECFKFHEIKVTSRGVVKAADIKSKRIVEQQYANLYNYAEVVKPNEILLTDNARSVFYSTFGVEWQDVVDSSMYNAADACEYLGVDHDALTELLLHAEEDARLGTGVHCARLDFASSINPRIKALLSTPIYVINGFYYTFREQYHAENSSIHYFVFEWDGSKLTWPDILDKVVGDSDPAAAKSGSMRNLVHKDWVTLNLHVVPSRINNYFHVSSSSFEALSDRLIWIRGVMLLTDLFGSRLLSARFKSTDVKEWLLNPVVEGMQLFEHLRGKNSTATVEYLLHLKNSQLLRQQEEEVAEVSFKHVDSFIKWDV